MHPSAPSTAQITVRLTVRSSDTQWGDSVALVGDHSTLSKWGTTSPILLNTDPFPVWTVTIALPPDTPFQYKYVIIRQASLLWEALSSTDLAVNRHLLTPSHGMLLVDDGHMHNPKRLQIQHIPSSPPSPVSPPGCPTAPTNTVDVLESERLKLPKPVHTKAPLAQSNPPTSQSSNMLTTLVDLTEQVDRLRQAVAHLRLAVAQRKSCKALPLLSTPISVSVPSSPSSATSEPSPHHLLAVAQGQLDQAMAQVSQIRHSLTKASDGSPPASPRMLLKRPTEKCSPSSVYVRYAISTPLMFVVPALTLLLMSFVVPHVQVSVFMAASLLLVIIVYFKRPSPDSLVFLRSPSSPRISPLQALSLRLKLKPYA